MPRPRQVNNRDFCASMLLAVIVETGDNPPSSGRFGASFREVFRITFRVVFFLW